VITVTGTCTTASTANSTNFSLPFTPTILGVGGAIDVSGESYGNGMIYTDGKIYTPTWPALNKTVVISGSYMAID
jgi:hypothetical protein